MVPLIVQKPMLVLCGIYLSGIVFIGLGALLSINYFISLLFALVTFLIYIGSVSLASVIVDTVYKDTSFLLPFKKALIIGSIVTLVVFPWSLVTDYLGTGQLSSSKFFFYSTVAAITVFSTTSIHSIIMEPSMIAKIKGLQPAKKKIFLDFSLELIKSSMWAITFLLLGTALSQILSGARIESDEMILIFYSFLGFFVLVIIPIVKSFADFLDYFLE